MHRFYIPPENWNPDALALRQSEAHHARDVLRMKRGDKAILFNGEGREITAEVIELHRDEIRLRKLHETETPPFRCRITLGQAIPKGKSMDLIVQKAVELGAAEIVPIISERTIVTLHAKEAAQKRAKWRQVAIEAAKQCGQNWLPHMHTPRTLKELFSDVATGLRPVAQETSHRDVATTFDLRLIGSLQPDAQHLKKILADYSRDLRPSSSIARGNKSEPEQVGLDKARLKPASVLILIGPEGDFTPAELALAKSHGCLPITLGPIILRVETAAIYCLSVLSYELLS